MATLLGALLRNESGGRNIANVHQGTSSGQAQGYFQITTGTWNDFGGRKYAANPLGATYEQQAEIASKIPLKRWDKSTIRMMSGVGKPIDVNRTLGENLAMNGEGFEGGARDGGAATNASYAPTPGTSMPGQAQPGPGRLGGDSMVSRDFDPAVEAAQPAQYSLRARHPQNPQYGKGGFIAEGAPNLGVDGQPIESKGAGVDYKPDTSFWKDLLSGVGTDKVGGAINPPDNALGGNPKAALAQSQQSGLNPEMLLLKRQKLAEAMARLQTGSLWG